MKEIEAKFYLNRIEDIPPRLAVLGAELLAPRALETNLRFDTPEGSLDNAHQLLRLRQYNTASLTFKSAAIVKDGVSERLEIETQVGDFETMRRLLEALSFRVSAVYEKYRAMYRLGDVVITLDELPYGNFIEIEGKDTKTIQGVAAQLGLDWETNITDNYMLLMNRLPGENHTELTFAAFVGREVSAQDLNVTPAD